MPSLIGVKTAGGDDAWYASMRHHLSPLSVFVPGHLLASGIPRGAHGSYSNVACLNPAAAQRWTDQIQTDLHLFVPHRWKLVLHLTLKAEDIQRLPT